MVRKIDSSLIAFFVLVAAAGANPQPTEASDWEAVPGLALALPADSNVKVRWVCPPLDERQVLDSRWWNICFAVDASGQPWLAVPTEKLVLNPTRQYRFSLSHSFTGIACLDSGALFFQTDRDLGFLGPSDKPQIKDGNTILPFQPAVSLPLSRCRVYAGTGNCLYAAGAGPGGNHEIYLLEPESTSGGGKKTLRSFRKVFECPEPIWAVAGDGKITFASFGGVIARMGRTGQTKPELIVHPADDIMDLAYLPGTGLFYATSSGVGVITDSGPWDFLRCIHPQIDLRGDTLYVLLKDTLGVLALDHVVDLARLRPAEISGIRTQPSPVEVTNLRFYCPAEDPNEKIAYATEFDENCQEIHACFTLHSTRKPGRETLLTVRWTYFQESNSGTVAVDLTDGQDRQCSSACSVGQGMVSPLCPGRYTASILIDGIEAASGSFEIRGKASVFEAIRRHDMQMLRHLLEQGADIEERNPVGFKCTALGEAAMTDFRAVELLLEYGAQVNARSDDSRTPLAFTQFCYSPATAVEVATTLIRHGADVNTIDNEGNFLLADITRSDHPELVELLLKHGANPNQMAHISGQASHLLPDCLASHYVVPRIARTLELLLAYGANPNAKDAFGRTALCAVIRNPEPHLVQILLRHGASLAEAYGGGYGSALRDALGTYLAATDRVEAQKAKDVVAILLRHGARLRPDEETVVADARLHTWLDQDLILDILRRNDQAVLDTTNTPIPSIRRMVVNRLIAMAVAKAAAATANDGYNAALALCDQAKTRVEAWQMAAQCPLVYFNTGLLYRHIGQIAAAKENFKRYIELAPRAPEADQIRQLIQSL